MFVVNVLAIVSTPVIAVTVQSAKSHVELVMG